MTPPCQPNRRRRAGSDLQIGGEVTRLRCGPGPVAAGQWGRLAIAAALAEALAQCGVLETDLIVSVVENKPEDWSFGHGRAQFLTGELT